MTNPTPTAMRIKVFADGADIIGIRALAANPMIKGFTTNPTLMRAAGVSDFESFAREVLVVVPDLPISFEVLSDDFDEMERQALKIASWGDNVFVKIPVTNCQGESSVPLIRRLAYQRIQMNVTALMTTDQVRQVTDSLAGSAAAFISVFAGRIADTGRNPLPIMSRALEIMAAEPHLELIWASPREVLNLFEAEAIGCHAITMTHDLLKKLPGCGKDLDQFSLETVQMFFDDAVAAGYSL